MRNEENEKINIAYNNISHNTNFDRNNKIIISIACMKVYVCNTVI